MIRSARKWLITGVLTVVVAFSTTAFASGMPTPRLKPPAPGPEYLTRADHARLLSLSDTLKKKRFTEARQLIGEVADPAARTLGQWMYYQAEDPTVDIDEADVFLDAHGDWPLARNIQRHVEGRLKSTTPVEEVLRFFDTRDPVSGDGRIELARALFAKGEDEAASIHLREAWVNYNFTVTEERRILSEFGHRLSAEDHASRVDRLLWERQVTNARRIFTRLSPRERDKAQARAAFLVRAASAPKLYRGLPREDQLDSGVLMAATRYYRRAGDEQKAIEYSALAPQDPEALRNPGRWWYERQLLMRGALKDGRFDDAYALAANNGLEAGGDLAEAEFNAGWIALRFLHAPDRAETHFLALASAVGTPISLSRAYYWLGRASAERGDAKMAVAYYEKAAQYYYSFYGQLAAEELGAGAGQYMFGPIAVATPADRALFSARPTVAALKMLSDLDLDYEFMVFAYHIDDQLERPGEYVELAKLANGEGAPHLTVRAGKVAVQRDAFAANVAYPLVFVPEEATRFVPAELILGLSRQESEFNPRAFSRAGARGMMQLIPSTALITARKEGLIYSRSALLDDPVYNLTLGSAHLSHLMSDFSGSLPLTLAAYNAGPHRAKRWIEEYGDPRSPNVDPIDWIELVPFSETRNYVQRVLENTQVYRGQLNQAPISGRLSADIERGGASGRAAKLHAPSGVLALKSTKHGAQMLAPLPERTAERAREYQASQAAKLAAIEQARSDSEAAAETSVKTEPAKKSRDRRSNSRRNRRPSKNKPSAETDSGAAPAATPTDLEQTTLVEPEAEAAPTGMIDAPAAEPLPQPAKPAPIALSLGETADRPVMPVEKPDALAGETLFASPSSSAAAPGEAMSTSSNNLMMNDEAMAALIAEARAVIASESGAESTPPTGNDLNEFLMGGSGAAEEEADPDECDGAAESGDDASDDLAAALNAAALAEFSGGADPCPAQPSAR